MQERLEEIGNSQLLKDIKLKDNKVILDFGDFRLKVLPDAYEEFNFKVGKEYSKDYLKQLLFCNDKYRVVRFVFTKLSKHESCESDIKQKIYKKFDDISKDATEAAMQLLIEEGVVNDAEYTKQAFDYFEQGAYGKYYIVNFFKSKNISEKIINELQFSEEDEKKKANDYFLTIKNKYVSNNIVSQKKKIFDALLKRGFSNEIASYLVSNLSVNPERELKILVKDYLKLKKKFSEKETNNEKIIDKVTSSLLHKGYTYDEINEVINMDQKGDLKND